MLGKHAISPFSSIYYIFSVNYIFLMNITYVFGIITCLGFLVLICITTGSGNYLKMISVTDSIKLTHGHIVLF